MRVLTYLAKRDSERSERHTIERAEGERAAQFEGVRQRVRTSSNLAKRELAGSQLKQGCSEDASRAPSNWAALTSNARKPSCSTEG